MKKKAVFGFLAAALLLAFAFPAFAAVPATSAPSAVPGSTPVWLAGLTSAPAPVGAGLDFLPKPLELTACSFPDRTACTQECHQLCSPCHYGGSTCTLENGCVCAECLCQ
jgi:hypothetical protein